MSETLYSVEQVAERLGLHVRTVRGYVREGRLKAIRIGKQYRISADDLATLTGRPASSFEPEPVRRHRHVEVSSIVEIDAISPDSVMRISNSLLGAAKGPPLDRDPLRIQTIYDDRRARLKVVLIGDPETVAWMLRLIATVLEGDA